MTFHKGDLLVIEPSDGDDPEAINRKGQTCRFLKYGVSGYAAVEFPGSRRIIYFRPQDLQPAQKELAS